MTNWYTFQYKNGSYAVQVDDLWRLIMNGKKLIEQNWRMRTHKWGHNAPKEDVNYRMKLTGEFKFYECKDADCPLTGCKHASCYFADYNEQKQRVILRGVNDKNTNDRREEIYH